MHKSTHSLAVSFVVEADSRGLFVLQASASLLFIVSVWFGMDGVEDQDGVLLLVIAAIYRNGVEKPAMRWTFEMALGARSDRNLRLFKQRLRGGFGIADRCSELNIKKFKVSLSIKDFNATAEFPKGGLYEKKLEKDTLTSSLNCVLAITASRKMKSVKWLQSLL